MVDFGASYSKFFEAPPSLLLEWRDYASRAVAYLAVESLRNNACGGGTRIKTYPSLAHAKDDAILLAKAMELKFAVAGMRAGGAKTVIAWPSELGDPVQNHSQRQGVLKRWFSASAPFLKLSYGTGPDQNTTEFELAEILKSLGIFEPRYGMARAIYGTDCQWRLDHVSRGVNEIIANVRFGERPCRTFDLATGFGVAEAVKCWGELSGRQITDARVLVEGLGSVGMAAAYFLQQFGARIVGVSMLRAGGAIEVVQAKEQGFSLDDLIALRSSVITDGASTSCVSDLSEINAEIFVPAATTGTITSARLRALDAAGVYLIAAGANSPFASQMVQQEADQVMSVLPDFIVNCGMARTFAFLLERKRPIVGPTWPHVHSAIAYSIRTALTTVANAIHGRRGILASSYEHWIRCCAHRR